jgi:hypothetical protein
MGLKCRVGNVEIVPRMIDVELVSFFSTGSTVRINSLYIAYKLLNSWKRAQKLGEMNMFRLFIVFFINP